MHSITGEFLDLTYSNMFYPLISRPTRITPHTATLIDNIFTNHIDSHVIYSGLLLTDISDHLPIFFIDFEELQLHNSFRKYVTFRDKNPDNMAKFNYQIKNINWSVIECLNDPSIAYTTFLEKYIDIYNCTFPLTKIKIKHNKKNLLYKQYICNPTYQRECSYKVYRHKLNHSLRIAKRVYYKEKLENSKSNLKITWKILNEIINRNRKSKPTYNV